MEDLVLFRGESPANYEQKCLCVLVLDTSGSMGGLPIQQLNQGLQVFQQEVMQDFIATQRLEIAIFTFGGQVRCIQQPALIDAFAMPNLQASGSTPLVDGMREAMRYVEERKKYYRATGQNYYRPIVILMTDGAPDGNQDVAGLSQEVRTAVDQGKFLLFGVGVEGYNHNLLASICPTHTPPLPLKGLNFSEFFKWLSKSVQIVSHSKQGDTINLPSVSGWTQMPITN